MLGIVSKGIIIGVLVSAPMGPIGMLCIQRTLNKGRWHGFVTGLGAVLWWFGITYIIGKLRKWFNVRGIWLLNRIVGSVIIVLSIIGALSVLLTSYLQWPLLQIYS